MIIGSPVNFKGNQSWIFFGRTDVEAEAPTLWPPDAKNWVFEKNSDAGKDWRQEKGTTQDEVVWWHHWLYGHEFEQALGVGNGQGNLTCCSPWGHKVLGTTEQLNWTELISLILIITLNVNGLNSPTKRHRLAGQIKTSACTHFHIPHHSAWPQKYM